MNKKGFLLAEETLKIIIAVISLIILSYLLFSLYNANKTNNELELAEESLNHLIDSLDSEIIEIQIYNPKGWFISSWPYDGERPLTCSNQGLDECICICDDSLNIFKSEVSKCNDASVCVLTAIPSVTNQFNPSCTAVSIAFK